MKKPVMLLLAAALCLGLTGCASDRPPERAADGSSWDEGWVTVGGVIGVDARSGMDPRENNEALAANALLWTQLVLFQQSLSIRLRNAVLFLIKWFWRVMGAALVQLVYLAVLVLFALWTVFLLHITGMWYIVFLSQLLIYEQLNEDLHIEESFS